MNLNIKDASPDDLQAFNNIKSHLGKTSKEVFTLLMERYRSAVNPENTGGNPELTEKLNTVIQNLESVTQQLTEKQNEVNLLTDKVTELETNQPEPLKDSDFIVKPTPKIAKAIELIKPGFYKKEFTKNTDPQEYKNELAKYAIRYFAQNVFPQYLEL